MQIKTHVLSRDGSERVFVRLCVEAENARLKNVREDWLWKADQSS